VLEEATSSDVPDMIGKSCVGFLDDCTNDITVARSAKMPTPAIANGTQTNIDGDGPGAHSGHDLAKSMKRNPEQIQLIIQRTKNPAIRTRPPTELELDTYLRPPLSPALS
jgi:hypothetical protein